MTTPVKLNLKIIQGSTFTQSLRWESTTKVYAPITSITQAAPVVIFSTAHGVPAGWRVKITNVGGMKEINNASEYYTSTLVSANSISINNVNSLGYSAYTTGGVLEYNQPMDLTGYTARMQLREKLASTTVLDEYTTANGKLVLDNTLKTIKILVDATTTAAYTFSTAVYSLELVGGTVVNTLVQGTITLEKEITR